MAEDKPSFGMQMVQAGAAAGANTLLGQVGDWLFGKKRDKRQLDQQKKLNDIALQTNKDMLTFSNEQSEAMQNRMWEKTNLSGQLDLMRKEGMSISAMYGGSGAGGSTTGSGGGSGSGVGAGQADGGVARGMMSLQFANQLAMQKAQVDNLRANTEKTQAEAQQISGVQTDKLKAETGLTEVTTQIRKIEQEVAKMTKSQAVDYIVSQAEKMTHEAVQAGQQQVITERTMEEQIQKIKAESIGALIKNEVDRSGIKLNEARIKEIAESIEQRWKGLDVDVENNKRTTEAILWGAGINAAGNLVGGITNILGKKIPTTNYQYKIGN
ncbi:DNA pilot protein [Tortoise microvirus 85]|nr:DNA pilot protein [Tortoise microvirus 85]